MDENTAVVVKAARAVFARYGVQRTRMADIAAEAQVARQTLYDFVAGRDELIELALVDCCRELQERLDADLAKGPQDLRERFRIVFTTFASVRFFRNDKGQTIGERGMDTYSPTARTTVSVFATIAMFAMSMWALLLVQIPGGLHSSPYPDGYPAHQINGLCNIPGNPNWTQPTAYGPCPGSPGFRMPVGNTFSPSTRG